MHILTGIVEPCVSQGTVLNPFYFCSPSTVFPIGSEFSSDNNYTKYNMSCHANSIVKKRTLQAAGPRMVNKRGMTANDSKSTCEHLQCSKMIALLVKIIPYKPIGRRRTDLEHLSE